MKRCLNHYHVKKPEEDITYHFHIPYYWLLSGWILVLFLSCGPVPDPTDWEVDSSAFSESVLKSYADTEKVLDRFKDLKAHEQVDSLVYLTLLLKNYDEVAALEYAQQAYNIALEKGWDAAQAVSAYYVAVLKMEKGRFGEGIEDALVDARISQRLFNQLDSPIWKARTNSLLGNLYFYQAKLDSAKNYNYLALKQLEKVGLPSRSDINLKGEIYHELTNIFISSDTSSVLYYAHKADSLYQLSESMADRSRLWFALGFQYSRQHEYSKADSLYQLCLKYARENNDLDHIADVYRELGVLKSRLYWQNGDSSNFEESLNFLKAGLNYEKDNFYLLYQSLGVHFQYRGLKTGKIVGNMDSTIYYYKLGMEEARKEGAFNSTKSLGQDLAALCDWLKEDTLINCADILGTPVYDFLNSNYGLLIDLVTKKSKEAYKRVNEVEQRELTREATIRRRQQLFISSGILFGAILIFLLTLQWQQQKRLKAKMEALRAQINPHFISNSLNAIESLVNLDQREAAAKYLIHFSRLARKILNNSRNPVTTLTDELQTLKHFLALEQLRFRDKLFFEINVDQSINSDLVEIPAMIMQPYLENAIWHGIKPKNGPGLLQIKVDKIGKSLTCIIEDDGIGRAKAAELKAASVLKQKSVGTKITEERLKLSKVKGAKVEMIDLYNEKGEPRGTRVLIRLPYKLKKHVQGKHGFSK